MCQCPDTPSTNRIDDRLISSSLTSLTGTFYFRFYEVVKPLRLPSYSEIANATLDYNRSKREEVLCCKEVGQLELNSRVPSNDSSSGRKVIQRGSNIQESTPVM